MPSKRARKIPDKIQVSKEDLSELQNSPETISSEEVSAEVDSEENEVSIDAQVESFDPIVMALDPNVTINSSSKSVNSNKFFLLDGHHRWKFAKNKNYINKLKCILVNFSDVNIKSYSFTLSVDKDTLVSKALSIMTDKKKMGCLDQNLLP